MKIEVTPIQGTANQFTVTLAGQYRLAFSGTKDNAVQVAGDLRIRRHHQRNDVSARAHSMAGTGLRREPGRTL